MHVRKGLTLVLFLFLTLGCGVCSLTPRLPVNPPPIPTQLPFPTPRVETPVSQPASPPPTGEVITVRITEADVAQFEEQLRQGPVAFDELQVDFRADGRIAVQVTNVRTGPLQIGTVQIVGRPRAENCVLHLDVEEISPRNMATAALPSLIEQALTQMAQQMCVQDIVVTEGEMRVTLIRR